MAKEFREYGTSERLDCFVDSDNFYDRIYAVNQHYAIDKLYDDENPYVREAVAYNGFYLEELSKDPDPFVKHAADIHIDYLENFYGVDVNGNRIETKNKSDMDLDK